MASVPFYFTRFGEVESDGRNLVRTFVEKPGKQNRNRTAGDFFVCKYEFLDYLSEKADCVLEREPMERLVREGQLAAYPHDGYWQCMDTHREGLAQIVVGSELEPEHAVELLVLRGQEDDGEHLRLAGG